VIRLQLNAIRYAVPNDFAMIIKHILHGLAMRATLVVALSMVCARTAVGQAPPADSLEQWVRRGYVLGTPESRIIWRELGWNGVGFGFRTFAARLPATDSSFTQSVGQFNSALDYYRLYLNDLQTKVEGDVGLAWGVHTEVFQVKGQAPESVRVRFTNTLRWDGRAWRNLMYHRDAQSFHANGRYVRNP
jgi:hypothetical protein